MNKLSWRRYVYCTVLSLSDLLRWLNCFFPCCVFKGRIIPGSPADRCGELKVDDRLLSVNKNDVSTLSHSEIVSMVKNSGLSVELEIEGPIKTAVTTTTAATKTEDTTSPPPPRPVEPRNYTPSFNSYNRTTDANLIEEYRKQRQVHNSIIQIKADGFGAAKISRNFAVEIAVIQSSSPI